MTCARDVSTPPVALVTGAGSGIGRAVAVRLIERNYRVVLAGRRGEELEATLSMVAGRTGSLAVPTDVTDPGAVEALFAAIAQQAGRLDLLVNNAGIFGSSSPVEDYSVDDWFRVIATNLSGAFLCSRNAFQQMIRQQPNGGRIINIGSLSAHVPRPEAVAYTASKHGITGLTKALALEGRRHRIACGQIDIGNALTELTSVIQRGALQPNGTRMPEPMISTDQAADAVLYMAGLPLDANILSLTVMASGMPYVGRG